jgi:hypothetical protein
MTSTTINPSNSMCFLNKVTKLCQASNNLCNLRNDENDDKTNMKSEEKIKQQTAAKSSTRKRKLTNEKQKSKSGKQERIDKILQISCFSLVRLTLHVFAAFDGESNRINEFCAAQSRCESKNHACSASLSQAA